MLLGGSISKISPQPQKGSITQCFTTSKRVRLLRKGETHKIFMAELKRSNQVHLQEYLSTLRENRGEKGRLNLMTALHSPKEARAIYLHAPQR